MAGGSTRLALRCIACDREVNNSLRGRQVESENDVTTRHTDLFLFANGPSLFQDVSLKASIFFEFDPQLVTALMRR